MGLSLLGGKSRPRAVYVLGFVVLLASLLVEAGGLTARLPWRLATAQLAYVCLLGGLVQSALLLAARWIGRTEARRSGDYVRMLLLLLFAHATLGGYFNPILVGPLDSRWYGNMMIDFITQLRAGRFPVPSGETIYAFNGAVHPFRSAPVHFLLAALVDATTFRTLAPLALQHLTAIVSFSAAVVLLYVGLVRGRKQSANLAFVVTLIYATSPGLTASFLLHDMYMTLMAAPWVVAMLLAAARAIESPSLPAYLATSMSCGALWFCHPPIALVASILAGFFLLGDLIINGVTAQKLTFALVAAVVFAVLAGPYFAWMSEIRAGTGSVLRDIALPVLALGLLARGLAGVLDGRSWIPPFVIGAALVWFCKHSMVNFGLLWSLGVLALAGCRRLWSRLQLRSNVEFWLLGSALAAAAAAQTWFPLPSTSQDAWRAIVLAGLGPSLGHFFQPFRDSALDQPGWACWFLLGGGLLLAVVRPSAFGRLSLSAAILLVVGLGLAAAASLFLWLNVPIQITDIIGTAYELRLLPVLAPVIAVGAFAVLSQMAGLPAVWARVVHGALALLLGWSLWEHAALLKQTSVYHWSKEATAEIFRPESVVLQQYSWDLLQTPLYFSNGVMDPRIECRYFAAGMDGRLLLGPDELADALRPANLKPTDLVATPIVTGPAWLTLAPTIELLPGEHKLLRFDFLGREPVGWLILKGSHLYREYTLPRSGLIASFGAKAGNTRTLSIWNSSNEAESIELLVKREGPSALADLPPGPYARVDVIPFDGARAPIEVKSLSPLVVRVAAPADGQLETFRAFYPGYKAWVDRVPAAVSRSPNGLAWVALSTGSHEVRLEFVGTPLLRWSLRWAALAWCVAGIGFLVMLVRSWPSEDLIPKTISN